MPNLNRLVDEMICRYCKKLIETGKAVKTLPYWRQRLEESEDVCHAECKVAGEKEEAYDCQTIDANCNECRHFLRASGEGTWRPTYKRFVQVKTDIAGWCAKLSFMTYGNPKRWAGMPCFEHRKRPTDIIGL